MRHPRLIGALVLGVGLAWVATHAASMDDNAIRGLEYAWNQAELHHDVKAVDALLADTFVRVDNRGRLVNKVQYLEEIGSHFTQSQEIVNEDIVVHMYGGIAIVVSTYHVKGSRSGKPFLERGRFVDTWVRLEDRWRCVANQETLVQQNVGLGNN